MRIGDAAAARLVALTDSADAAAQNNLGVVLRLGGRAADAELAFDRAVALDAGVSVARRNLRVLASEGTTAASARWRRVRTDAADDDSWRALVRHHTARGEFDAAADALARWECASTTAVAPALERARWAIDAGHPDVALDAVARARAGASAYALAGDVALFARLDLLEARAAYQRGDSVRALASVERARAATPDDPEAELLRSFVLGELGATDAAVASRARAAALDPALARVDVAVAAEPLAARPAGASDAEGSRSDPAPDRTRTRYALATAAALRHKGYYGEALAALGPLAADQTPGTRAAALAASGVVHLLRGAAAEAAPALAASVQVTGGVAPASHTLALAAALLLAGDHDAAEVTVRPVARDAESSIVCAGATTIRALVAWRRGDLPSARMYLLDAAARARGLDADVRAALAGDLALLLADAGVGPAAVAAGAAAVRLAPGDPASHAAHGRALAHVGDHEAARAAFSRACALAPDDAAARYGLAFAAGASGDRAAAQAELARATTLSPVVRGPAPRLVVDADGAVLVPGDGSPVRATSVPDATVDSAEYATRNARVRAHDYTHVDARFAAGEYERALAAVDAALARGAPAAEGLVRAGHALARSGQLSLALERYDRAAAAAPLDPRPERYVIRALHRLGRFVESGTRAAAALARWPGDASFAALRARAAADHGAVDEAVAALDRCARACRDAVDAADPAAFWADVACAWQALGAWDAAADAWSEAARAVPALPSPTLARARALARAGRADAAEALLEALADRAPGLADVWRARADLAIETGRLSAAQAHLTRVVDHDRGDGDALAALAAACADACRFDEARTAAADALRIDPEHPLALAVCGDCAANAGDRAAACDAWRRALAVLPVGAGAARARMGLRRDEALAEAADVSRV
ncbi:hypothetical protein tb265_28740 [Gemmatimonadetes bacterium T265]|nr:hypothetical protein tb265_28740 [Gemmatimonadetes bacterium T265]